MKKGTEKPWEQQPGESGPAFEAFSTYRDFGPGRTVSAVAEKLQKSSSLIRKWQGRWNWRERAAAYDNSITEEARRKAVKEHKDMENRHIGLAMQLQKKALEALNLLEAKEMSPKDIKEFVKMATELERLTRSFEEQRTAEAQDTGAGTGLADAIMAAYNRRKEDGDA